MAILRQSLPTPQDANAPPWSMPINDANLLLPYNALNDGSLGYVNGILTDTGTANNYIVNTLVGSGPSAYNDGMTVFFNPTNYNNSGASTLTVQPLGSVPLLTRTGAGLNSYCIYPGQMVGAVYSSFSPAGFRIFTPLKFTYLASYSVNTNPVFGVSGYDSVALAVRSTSASTVGIGITIANLADGVPVTLNLWNQAPSTGLSYWINTTDLSGNSRATQAVTYGTNPFYNGGAFAELDSAVARALGPNTAMNITGSASGGTFWVTY